MDGRNPIVIKMETPGELAEWLADQAGIYDDRRCYSDSGHVDQCLCRVFWVPDFTERIRQSVANEKALAVMKVLDKCTRIS